MTTIHDLIGIGIGPFNLGLAALCHDLPLSTIFLDQKPEFNWHPGLLIEGARMQVPFYADLVTLADPCNPFSYFAYLKAQKRFFRFAFREQYYLSRKEYCSYCQWVAKQLPNLCFGSKVTAVNYSVRDACYHVAVLFGQQEKRMLKAKRLVMGIGTVPCIPESLKPQLSARVFHSSSYLEHKEEVLQSGSTLIVGSGQSAAEIFYDLLQQQHRFVEGGLAWCTRSPRFYPMDTSKLSLELTSPEYIRHFYSLSRAQKQKTLSSQQDLYKGINNSLISQIYDALYELSLDGELHHLTLRTHTSLQRIEEEEETMKAYFKHEETGRSLSLPTKTIILATGYQYEIPSFLQSVKERIRWQLPKLFAVQPNYSISKNESDFFVQNAELHTHGFSAPDLGLGPYRNAVILNEILGYEHFVLEKSCSFQQFG